MRTRRAEYASWAWLVAAVVAASFAFGQSGPIEGTTVSATDPAGVNSFAGKVQVGTPASPDPSVKLEVEGDGRVNGGLTISGALRVPVQGDLSAGEFVEGLSGGGSTAGLLPAGALGNLLYFDGTMWVPLTGFTYDPGNGTLTSSGGKITGLPTPEDVNDAATKGYVDGAFLNKGPDSDMDGNRIGNVGVPVNGSDAATKGYVDGTDYGAQCCVSAYSPDNFTAADQTYYNIGTTEEFDAGNNYDHVSTRKLTVPSNGKYLVTVQAGFVGAADNSPLTVRVLRNGNEVVTGVNYGGYVTATATKVLNLTQGDNLKFQVWQNSGVSRTICAWRTFFSVVKVGP
jgi:hypothetical protein